ncbi:MAG: ABC transporter ATP-binding protein [Pseudodesulfovibrio sp.]|uniref:ABC transporter ATP-binding protein n=1 Tax=Pseudodesulfovibrio sp. TaxID=2035812 RepID=UPI003D0C334C
MSGDWLISLEGVGCSFKARKGRLRLGEYEAFNDISFNLYPGETLGVVGRNGAGKTTLLRILARIFLPNKGTIRFRDDLTISLLSLQLGFSPDLSGRYNAIMGAILLGYTRKEAEARLDRIIEFSGLGAWIDEPIKTYSDGMCARLGFAVAMETSPDVLLVDEVLGVGDETFRNKSVMAMKERLKSGQTVVFVSHDVHTLQELCTRVIWLEHGRVRMDGSAEDVLSAYMDFMRSESVEEAPLG